MRDLQPLVLSIEDVSKLRLRCIHLPIGGNEGENPNPIRPGCRISVLMCTKCLVKQLDKALVEFKDAELQAVVHLLGEDRDELLEQAKKMETKAIPVTVPVESETGPENWSINPDADLTVFTYKGKKVTASHGYVDVTKKDVQNILNSVKKVAS